MKDIHEWAEGLRELADFAEEHPCLFERADGEAVHLFARNREELAEKARDLGTAEKHEDTSFYYLVRRFGPHQVTLNIEREKVCTRIQTGVEEILAPDPEAVKQLPLVKTWKPTYEWSCPDSILKVED